MIIQISHSINVKSNNVLLDNTAKSKDFRQAVYVIYCVPVLSLERSGINVFVFNYSSANEFFPKGIK